MAKTAILAVKVIGDASGASRALDQTGKSATNMGRRMQTATRAANVVTGGLFAVAIAARRQASDLQQANGAVEAVFKSQATAVQNLAKTAATSLGLARSEYTQTAAVLGAQLKNMGVSAKQLVPQTDQLIRLGGDLAATYGGTTSQAVAALSSLLRGETDPIEQYGVSIKQADIAARLAAQGQDKLTGAAKKAATTEALLALLMKQTTDAQGQRGRESESDAQKQEQAIAGIKNAAADMATSLLPAFAALSGAVATAAAFMTAHGTETKIVLGIIAGLAVAVYAVNAAMAVYAATMAVVRVAVILFRNAQLALNLAMMANPIGLIIAAVLLLVAGFVLLYKNSETFRKIIGVLGKAGQIAIQWIVDKAQLLWQKIQILAPAVEVAKTLIVGYFKLITAPIRIVVDLVKSLVNWIKKIDFPSPPEWVSEMFGRGGPPQYAYAGGLGGRRAAYSVLPGRGGPGDGGFVSSFAGRGGATVINIQVTGAIDPDSVARQISNLLAGRNRRLGRA